MTSDNDGLPDTRPQAGPRQTVAAFALVGLCLCDLVFSLLGVTVALPWLGLATAVSALVYMVIRTAARRTGRRI